MGYKLRYTAKTNANRIRILVCSTCIGDRDRGSEGKALYQAIKSEGLDKTVRLEFGGCLNACDEPVAMGLQGSGRASYVFSGIDPVKDAEDIARTCKKYLELRKGWIIDAQDCGRLRYCLRARLPAWD